MLKVAIVGCGKIADEHAAQLRHIERAELVAVLDQEPLMARQLAERFGIDGCYTELPLLLSEVRPDIVHVTTPPRSHYPVAKQCLEAGAHVYVEKPFALDEGEVRALIALGNERGLKLTAGHDYQFCHAARRARELIASGYLGEGPVHMDCYFCYPIGKTPYSNALFGDKNHWIHSLPGLLLHNIISHGIARIAEHLVGDSPHVMAHGFTSPVLRELGEERIVDELRVMITDEAHRTAYFTFSSQMRPALHQFTIYGTENGLVLDQDKELLIRLPGKALTSYLEKFVPPVVMAREYRANLKTNLGKFARRDFHMKAGQKFLMEQFYQSIEEGTPLPISYREIVMIARIMDQVFTQLASQQAGPSNPKAQTLGEAAG